MSYSREITVVSSTVILYDEDMAYTDAAIAKVLATLDQCLQEIT